MRRMACGFVPVLALLALAGRAAPPLPSPCAAPEPPVVTDLAVRQPAPLAEPVAGAPFRDPAFARCVVRLTDRTRDVDPEDDSKGLKNEYSRVQAWNADESRILIRGIGASWYLYDAATLRKIGRLPFDGSVDPRWDAADPDVLLYSDGTRLMRVDVRSGVSKTAHDFAADFPGQALAAVRTRYEGSPSEDGRLWGLMAQDLEYRTVAFLVYDAVADRVIASRDLRGVAGTDGVDSVTISPLGRFFVSQWEGCPEGRLGSDASPCGLMVHDAGLAAGRGLSRLIGHSDLALDAAGREVMVYQDNETDEIAVLDLASGARTALVPIDFSHDAIGLHFSGRSLGRPGWAVVSTHDGSAGSSTWMDDQVFALELVPGGRVVRLSHTRSIVDTEMEQDYWAEPQATVNRDLTRVLFTSNWGRSGTEAVDTYLVAVPWEGDCPGRPCRIARGGGAIVRRR